MLILKPTSNAYIHRPFKGTYSKPKDPKHQKMRYLRSLYLATKDKIKWLIIKLEYLARFKQVKKLSC